ncbi:hypothetical protein ACFY8K_16870 [Streptomyces misionensis]|uniref:hypothetical protein n=1 Tax=Streptomyces misionensis TaxID=67331 RepID=UPI0036B5FDEB
MQQRTHTPPQPPSLTTRGPIQGQHTTRVADALHALCSPTIEPWPEGVFARYLTVVGATVDLTHTDKGETISCCTGCGDSRFPNSEIYIRSEAQRHASACRALPRPAVS